MNNKTRNLIFNLSALCVLCSAALFITGWFLSPYVFAVGAAGMAVTRLTRIYNGNNLRLKRLYRMETLSSLLIVAASYFMFRKQNEWFLLLTIAAVLQLYTAILIPGIEKKENEK
ncbi:hypothetical protein [Coprobacter tertius]|uniref:ATP synthase subunit I n=1 Tax=Coprobacter tertius TaxID=2944915 RepID=A0ABT1MIN9_9BACT|nr:hypothetical protein [Coprobacter tertius]MCP9611106.1 hypothetical protein [Coprobacter tertius]